MGLYCLVHVYILDVCIYEYHSWLWEFLLTNQYNRMIKFLWTQLNSNLNLFPRMFTERKHRDVPPWLLAVFAFRCRRSNSMNGGFASIFWCVPYFPYIFWWFNHSISKFSQEFLKHSTKKMAWAKVPRLDASSDEGWRSFSVHSVLDGRGTDVGKTWETGKPFGGVRSHGRLQDPVVDHERLDLKQA